MFGGCALVNMIIAIKLYDTKIFDLLLKTEKAEQS